MISAPMDFSRIETSAVDESSSDLLCKFDLANQERSCDLLSDFKRLISDAIDKTDLLT